MWLANVYALLGIVYFASLPFFWAWMFYHKIKCRKAENCCNRKCTYWHYCEHNYVEQKKDEIELRVQLLLHNLGLTEEEIS